MQQVQFRHGDVISPAEPQDAPMPEDVDPDDNFVTDDAYSAGRKAFQAGASVLENPMAQTGDWGKAWFSGWLDALADAVTGQDRARGAYARLLRRDRAEPF